VVTVKVNLKQSVTLRLDPNQAKALGLDPLRPYTVPRGESVQPAAIAAHWAVKANS
jgi:hypothetical protein